MHPHQTSQACPILYLSLSVFLVPLWLVLVLVVLVVEPAVLPYTQHATT